ncbi:MULTISPECIES: toxin-antitoxin system TumE family protein [Natrialbaceae]|uniref:toxin-antitoxin system TumE family protein n=1 Tax=Natrialbaceae TaxID=1644061 RepID=UPI00207CD9B7|nr:DUF6516 family protein [Natronococcus sp. CG52]
MKYSLQYGNEDDETIIRYDSFPDHPGVGRRHKHRSDDPDGINTVEFDGLEPLFKRFKREVNDNGEFCQKQDKRRANDAHPIPERRRAGGARDASCSTARLVDRDIRQVHRNLEEFEGLHPLEFEHAGRSKKPTVWYDSIEVDLPLTDVNPETAPA